LVGLGIQTLADTSIYFGKYQTNPHTCRNCGYVHNANSEKMTDVRFTSRHPRNPQSLLRVTHTMRTILGALIAVTLYAQAGTVGESFQDWTAANRAPVVSNSVADGAGVVITQDHKAVKTWTFAAGKLADVQIVKPKGRKKLYVAVAIFTGTAIAVAATRNHKADTCASGACN
jgi:hypothetical protein